MGEFKMRQAYTSPVHGRQKSSPRKDCLFVGLSETFAAGETRLAPAGALRRRKVVLRQSAGSLLELLALGGIAA